MGNCYRKKERIVVANLVYSKIELFRSQDSETSFYELSSSRTGKHIRWKRGELLSEGTEAKVYQCIDMETGEFLVTKNFSGDFNRKVLNACKKQIKIMKELDHPHIVSFCQADLSPHRNGVDILLEYVPGGSLSKLINDYGSLSDSVIKKYSIQVLKALEYLHRNFIVHRDVKSANVLVTADGFVKLTDFGSSKKFLTPSRDISWSMKGNPFNMAPEIALRQGHSFPCDIWSFGCLMIEMATGTLPWTNLSSDPIAVFNHLCTEDLLPDIPQSSELFVDIVSLCLNRNPALRPTATVLLKHPYYQD